ncbi:MAG: hypothetical protein M4D80_18050 [Myxococcota bacterium]|nr:hypothetical protein [Deltaproteobacteria bacterium]MDQ3337069.1 hypothetical protein [Myxococcota bacterium]
MAALGMATKALDKPWQKLPDVRRAAVYRGFGRAIREARETKEVELEADMRVAFGVLRAHSKGTRAAAKKKK